MHPLDIISESPTFFILQKESNKTNFGGFLIVFYSIIMIGICIFYGIKYHNDDNYNVQSLIHFNFKSDAQKEERKKSDLFNPTKKFQIDLKDYNDKSLNDKFKLYDIKIKDFIDRKKTFQKKISEFEIFVVYECEELNCSDYYNNYLQDKESSYRLETTYEGFQMEHQNEEPIQKKCKADNGTITDCQFECANQFKYSLSYKLFYYWKTILYKEKSFIKKIKPKSCGYIQNYDSFYYINGLQHLEIKNKNHTLLNIITIEHIFTQYLEYIRTENTILDLLANIFSFISNIFFGARFIFKYYSKNFNNFKVIEKLMSDSRNNGMNFDKKNNVINSLIERENHKTEENNDFNKLMPLTDDISITEKLRNDIKDFEDIDEDDIDEMRLLRKLHFFDFFLNNLYINQICQKQKSQNIINACNKILYKYASIDTIVYNQILMENLLKDYKWNDPSLNNVENNSLFIELKTYL